MKIHTKNPEQTQQEGKEFAKKLKGGDVVLLFGNLGAGKTTFTQGLAKGLGIIRRIISPTFIIVRKYEVTDNPTIKTLYHIDLYRIETENDLRGIGMEEILLEKDAVVIIEWPEKLGNFLPKKRWEITFTPDSENTRNVTIN